MELEGYRILEQKGLRVKTLLREGGKKANDLHDGDGGLDDEDTFPFRDREKGKTHPFNGSTGSRASTRRNQGLKKGRKEESCEGGRYMYLITEQGFRKLKA